jgi:transcriptional regulator with XRE-family HTH domain
MESTIGGRIKHWRMRRGGMSQAVLAGLAGLSQPYISQIEAGRRSVDSRTTLIAIASALQVTVADLLDQPGDPTDPARNGAADAVPTIWASLLEISDGERGKPTSNQEQIRADLARVSALRNAGRYARMPHEMPALLAAASGHGGILLAEAAYLTSTCLRHLGYRHVAVEAARIAQSAAEEAGHPAWRGAARFAYAQALPVEAAGVAARAAARTMIELQPRASDRAIRQVLGQLHLAAALRSAVDGRPETASDHLAEAEREAASLGEPGPSGGFNAMCFGPSNVTLWRMSIAVDAGEHGRAVELAHTVDADALPIVSRRHAYWLDLGRALAHSGRSDVEALAALTRAEQVAPSLFALNPLARDAVSTMVRRARHRAAPKGLRVLARRLDITVDV